MPRAAAEGDYDAAAIYDPTPYQAGMTSNDIGAKRYPFADKTFDYEKLYAPDEKREPAGEKSTMDLAEVATTGVEGLKTIIPLAGISNWYEYSNSQGVSIYSEPHYTDIWKKKDIRLSF